jgi:hypothetical protein
MAEILQPHWRNPPAAWRKSPRRTMILSLDTLNDRTLFAIVVITDNFVVIRLTCSSTVGSSKSRYCRPLQLSRSLASALLFSTPVIVAIALVCAFFAGCVVTLLVLFVAAIMSDEPIDHPKYERPPMVLTKNVVEPPEHVTYH